MENIMWYTVLIMLLGSLIRNIILQEKIHSMKQGVKDIEREMKWECIHIKDADLRERILNILRVMILKRFK